ncbi:MAG TPA: CAP domain-containing protein, partial [Anaerolineales bacterium]|nr:CAP domain-containing protein [Anaerolineales bacterium]
TLITVGKYTARAPATPTTGPTTSTTTSGSSSGPGLATVTCSYKTNPDFVSQTLALINNARTANGLPALTLNDQLSEAAQSHSADMACNGFLSHTGWNGSTVASRIAAAGYTSSFQVENIYAQPPQYGGTPQSAMDWWMGDPIHRDAVLNADATEVGIGYSYYANSPLGGYFAIDFAAP